MEKIIKSVEWQKVHIFISSTFNDMHAERDYLVKKVFPRLVDWCEKRKIRMVDIDLRWGVSEADTMNKKVVGTCLKYIDECRPFFICLLGQRRGWVPKKEDISPETYKEFSDISGYAGNASVTEMEILHALIDPFHKNQSREKHKEEYYEPVKHAFFYVRDPSYLKSLISAPDLLSKAYTNELDELMEGISRQTADDELRTWREKRIPETNRRNYTAKWNSAAQTPELRIPLTSSSDKPESRVSGKWRRLWKFAGINLNDTDIAIPENLLEKAKNFNSIFTQGRLGEFKTDNEELGDVIFNDLTAAIRVRFKEHIETVEAESEKETDLQKEIDQQEQFVYLNSVGFIKRTGDFDQLDEYAADDSKKLFVITAPAGMGKSMFLAKWVDRYRAKVNPENNESLHFRFIGQSDKSTSFYNVWHTLLEEIKEHTGKLEDEVVKDAEGRETRSEAIPADPVKLHNALPDILKKIGAKGKTIIVLDALNQLETGLKDLYWLQSELPAGIKMIVSFKHDKDDENAKKLYERLKERVELAEIKPFEGPEDRKKLINEYLKEYLKELDQKHINALLEIEATKRPLFLKIVLNELRIFGAFLNIKDKIRSDFGNDPLSAFEGVFKRLEDDPAYSSIPPKISVPLIFGLLATARYGLSADELAHMLLTTLGYENTEGRLNEIKETVYLYLRQVRPYLARKEGRYDFFYESFKIAARKQYVNEESIDQISDFKQENAQLDLKSDIITLKTKDWHKIIADYFYELPLWIKKSSKDGEQNLQQDSSRGADYKDDPNKRKVSELPYHLTMAEDWGRVEETLCNILFVEAKVRSVLVFDLQEDYRVARNALPEAQKILEEEQRNATKIIRWTEEITRYSSAWSERRDRTVWWRRPEKAEPLLPVPPVACRIWKDSEIGAERERINKAPKRMDRLDAFAGFVTGEYNPLAHFGGRESFTLQHATNYSPGGPVNHAASGRLSGCGGLLLLRRWPDRAVWIPRPALLRTLEDRGMIYGVSVAPDGRRAVSASDDHALRVWDLESGACLLTLAGHSDSVMSVSVTPNGRRAISGSVDRTLRVWNMENGACLRTLTGHSDAVLSVSVTPDGRRAVSGSKDHSLRVWELENGKCLGELKGHGGWVQSIGITPDGRLAFSGGSDHTLRLWDLERWKCLGMLKGHDATVSSVSSTPDGRRVMSGSRDNTIRVWDFVDVKLGTHYENILNNGYEAVQSVCMTPDGQIAASGGFDRLVQVWSTYENAIRRRVWISLRRLKGHNEYVNCVSVTPDGRRAVSGSADKTLRIWDLERGDTGVLLANHVYRISAIALTPDGRRAVSASYDGELRVWDLESRDCVRTLAGHRDAVISVCVTPDGRRAVSASIDKTLRVWDLERDDCLRTLEGAGWAILTPDGRRVLAGSGGEDRTIRVWDLEGWTCLHTLEGARTPITLTPDGRRVVAAGTENAVDVWDLESGTLLHLKGHNGDISCISVSPDGRRAVSGSMDHTLRVWNLESGACLRTLKGHNGCATSVSVTPDGRHAVSVSSGDDASVNYDHKLRLWDLESGTCLCTMEGHSDRVRGLIVTPDGRCVVSWSNDRTLRAWDLQTGDCLGIFYAGAPVTEVALSSGCLVIGTEIGQVLFVEMRNHPSRPMIKPD